MNLLDPNNKKALGKYDEYLSKSFGKKLALISAKRLKGGYRNRLWLLTAKSSNSIERIVLRTVRQSGEGLVNEAYPHNLELEFRTLKELRSTGMRVPEVWGLDNKGDSLGIPCFLMEFIDGQPLDTFFKSNEKLAAQIFLSVVQEIQSVKREQLGEVSKNFGKGTGGIDVIEWNYARFPQYTNDALFEKAHDKLISTSPPLLELRFGNGDLSTSNILVKNRKVAAIIDFEFAGYFDPMFEFLTPFNWCKELKNRGLEQEYCKMNGYNPDIIDWYRATSSFCMWLGLLADPESESEGCTAASVKKELADWVKHN